MFFKKLDEYNRNMFLYMFRSDLKSRNALLAFVYARLILVFYFFRHAKIITLMFVLRISLKIYIIKVRLLSIVL